MDHKKRSFLLVLFLVCLCSQTQAWDKWGEQWDSYGETDLEYYMQQPDPYYDAVCTAKDRCVTTCSANYKKGCVCYNDGSCYEQQVSRCHSCTDPTVFAVFEGKSCPKRHPYICSHSKKSGRFHRGSLPRCSGKKYSSCICSKDGQCTRKKVDLCTLCRSDSDYQAIFFNSSCPDTSLKATCNKTFSPLPPPTTCNNPTAYTCTDEDRTSIECNLVSSGVSCVCYQNGTCLSQPSSACACQRPDIVSVTNGSYCPTNCTVESDDEAENEEGEGEAEEEEEAEAEAEGEAEGEAEAEAEAENEAESEEEESSESSLPNITNITNITNVIPAAAAAVPEDRLANVANITNITNITNDTASDADLENENEEEGELEEEEESSENSLPNITNITNVTNVFAAPTPAPDNQLTNVTNVTNVTSATN